MPTDFLARANALVELRRYKQAEEVLREGLKQCPNAAALHSVLALCLLRQEKIVAARKVINTAISLDPEDSYSVYVLSLIESEAKDWNAAIAAAESALRIDPTDSETRGHIAWIHNQLGDWAKCLQAAESGLAHSPTHENCLILAGLSSWYLNKRPQAETYFAEALRLYPNSGYVHYIKGLAQTETTIRGVGHASPYAQVVEHLLQCLRLSPDIDHARQLLQCLMLSRFQKIVCACVAGLTFVGMGAIMAIHRYGAPGELNVTLKLSILSVIAIAFCLLLCTLSPPVGFLLLKLSPLGRTTFTNDQHVATRLIQTTVLGSIIAAVAVLLLRQYHNLQWIMLILFLLPGLVNLALPRESSKLRLEGWAVSIAGLLFWTFAWVLPNGDAQLRYYGAFGFVIVLIDFAHLSKRVK